MCFTVEWIDKNNQKLSIQSYLKLQFFSEFERTSLFRLGVLCKRIMNE